jgi:hypothetical protein
MNIETRKKAMDYIESNGLGESRAEPEKPRSVSVLRYGCSNRWTGSARRSA